MYTVTKIKIEENIFEIFIHYIHIINKTHDENNEMHVKKKREGS
jgi:hypothetical protein